MLQRSSPSVSGARAAHLAAGARRLWPLTNGDDLVAAEDGDEGGLSGSGAEDPVRSAAQRRGRGRSGDRRGRGRCRAAARCRPGWSCCPRHTNAPADRRPRARHRWSSPSARSGPRASCRRRAGSRARALRRAAPGRATKRTA